MYEARVDGQPLYQVPDVIKEIFLDETQAEKLLLHSLYVKTTSIV